MYSRNQNTQEIKRTLFNWTKHNKTCTFSRKSSFLFFFFLLLFFQATYSKNRNKLLIQLILCQMFGGWRKEKGERLTHGGLSLTTKFSRPQPSHYINKRQGMGSGTVLDPATLSEAALLWKSQQSNISAELFQLCCLAGRQAPLLVSVTTVSGYKTLRNTL